MKLLGHGARTSVLPGYMIPENRSLRVTGGCDARRGGHLLSGCLPVLCNPDHVDPCVRLISSDYGQRYGSFP